VRRYIFTDRERRLLEQWIDSETNETQGTRDLLTKIRKGWPRLADDLALLFRVARTMMSRRRWRGYATRGSEYGSALRRAESALTRLRSAEAT
jgi:hypothetical protein